MKKLVSIFAALAMVGALAAQKRKAPAKKAAAPAPVAAPAAPAAVTTPAPVVAAPVVAAPAASGKGLGLSIEARGGYTLAGGSSTAYGNSGSQTDGANTAIKYELSNSYALGGGATVAYEIAQSLGVTLGFDYRSFTTRQYSAPLNSSPWTGLLRELAYLNPLIPAGLWQGGNGADGFNNFGKSNSAIYKSDYSQKTTWKNMVLTLGIRPSVNILGGRVYAGGGLAVVLPYETTTDVTFSNKAGAAASGMPDSGTQTDKWGLGLGGFGEIGYNYNITDNVFAGIGVRVVMATTNNSGLTRKIEATKPDGSKISATIDIAESVTEAEKSLTSADGGKTFTAKQGVSSNGITDITAQVTVGYRL